MTRRGTTAIGLAAVGVAAWWVVGSRGGAARVWPSAQVARPDAPLPVTLFDYDAQRLRLDPSDAPPVRTVRNPFRFATPPRDDATETPSRGPVRASRAEPTPSPDAAEPVPFTLVGIATRQDGATTARIAVLAGRGQLMLAAQGETVDSQYVVDTVGEDAVELRNATTGRVVRLALR